MDEQTLADRWTDRHINRPCEQTGQKGEKTRSKQIGKPTDLRANRQTEGPANRQEQRHADDGQMDGQTLTEWQTDRPREQTGQKGEKTRSSMQTTDRWTDRH